MKSLSLIALLAIAASPLFAAEIPVAPKKSGRTLKEVIDLAIQQGKDSTLSGAMADKLGLGASDLPEKRLRFKQSICPDKHEHNFRVVAQRNPDGTLKPIAIQLSRVSGGKVGDKMFTDGIIFLADLDGKLAKALHNKGYAGEIKPEEMPITSSEVKKAFRNELDFIEKQSLDLQFDR